MTPIIILHETQAETVNLARKAQLRGRGGIRTFLLPSSLVETWLKSETAKSYFYFRIIWWVFVNKYFVQISLRSIRASPLTLCVFEWKKLLVVRFTCSSIYLLPIISFTGSLSRNVTKAAPLTYTITCTITAHMVWTIFMLFLWINTSDYGQSPNKATAHLCVHQTLVEYSRALHFAELQSKQMGPVMVKETHSYLGILTVRSFWFWDFFMILTFN